MTTEDLLGAILVVLEDMRAMQKHTMEAEVGTMDEKPTDQADHDPPVPDSE